MTKQAKPDRKKRPFWQKILAVLGIWIALIYVENKIIQRLDKSIRADRSIFVEYVERLPNPLTRAFADPFGSVRGNCETFRVGGLWSYDICTKHAFSVPNCKSSPFFIVNYYRPKLRSFPEGQTWVRSPLYLELDKEFCAEIDISQEPK